MEHIKARIARLSCWSGTVAPQYLAGGLTNVNFLVDDRQERFVVRVGDDIPVHHILRFNELNAALAAARIGLSPAIVHHEPGILVMEYVPGRTLEESDVRQRDTLLWVTELIKHCHSEMARELHGPALAFWPFHVIHDYAHTLREGKSRCTPELGRLVRCAEQLERAVGPGETVFCHNDLLAANFLDDGVRLWLVDWDYGGFGNPLFDLAGLASNSQLGPKEEQRLLETYFESEITDGLYHRFRAMKAVSLLREAMWSMVQELHSGLDVDYVAYTAENMDRFQRAWDAFRENG